MRGETIDRGAAIGDRTRREFSDLYRWVHSIEPRWWTTGITFQRGPEWVRLNGTRWRLQLSVIGMRRGWTRNSHILYRVGIALSPGFRMTPTRRRDLQRARSYARVKATLRKLGYRGEWHLKGTLGLFDRDFRGLTAVKGEMDRLQAVNFKDLLGDIRGRTTR